MKKRFFSLLLALALLATLTPLALAAQLPLEDDETWTNLTLSQANSLLSKMKNGTADTGVFFYYQDSCWYSANYVPQFYAAAARQGLRLYGYNHSTEGTLSAFWSLPGVPSSIGFPCAAAYNSDTGTLKVAHSVRTLEDFAQLLESCGLGGSDLAEVPQPEEETESQVVIEQVNDTGIDSEAWEVLRLTNQHRVSMGLPPLSTSDSMQRIANQRAYELTLSFSHTRPDGTSCFTAYDMRYNAAAENIAMGQRNAQSVVASWLNSPGHRANIEGASLSHLGVGHNGNGWSQNFIGGACSYSAISLSASTLNAGGESLEDRLTQADIWVTATCSSHGTCYLPLIAGMCSGFDADAAGEQKLTVRLGSASATLTVPAACTSHQYDSGRVTQAATCKTAGTKTYTCTVCGAEKTETIPLADHSLNRGAVTRAATCTAAGLRTYTCTLCGYQETERIAPLGHSVNADGRCTRCGVQVEQSAAADPTPRDRDPETSDREDQSPEDESPEDESLEDGGASLPFSDSGRIRHRGAVSRCVELGIINGKDDGTYAPYECIDRASWAKMVYIAATGHSDGSGHRGLSTGILDVDGNWAEGYIKYLAAAGTVSGDASGNYMPGKSVTVVEAAKMLLTTLGYRAEDRGYVGSTWADSIMADAYEYGLMDQVDQERLAELSRDNAAQMIRNALDSQTVTPNWTTRGGTRTVRSYQRGETLGDKNFAGGSARAGALPQLPEAASTRWHYSQLDTGEKLCYQALENNIDAIRQGEDITLDQQLTWEEAENLRMKTARGFEAFTRDHPEIFWTYTRHFSWSGTTDQVDFVLRLETHDNWKGSGRSIAADESFLNQQIRQIANEALEAGDSRYERLLYLHDWLTGHNSYNETAAGLGARASEDYTPWTPISAMDYDMSPVCEGYSKAFLLLCDQLNIPCIYVSGSAHAWNYVQMEDGNWYGVDVTYDDPIYRVNGEKQTGVVSGGEKRDYFLAGSDTFVADHSPISDWDYPELSPSAYAPQL